MEQVTKTQKQLIKDWLLQGNTISALEALRDFGCYRLGARISDLRREGLRITTKMESSRSKITGKPISYARYTLTERPN